jgi:hypothetical protein
MGLKMFGDDLVKKTVHSTSNGRNSVQDRGAIGFVPQRTLNRCNLPADATDTSDQIGVGG